MTSPLFAKNLGDHSQYGDKSIKYSELKNNSHVENNSSSNPIKNPSSNFKNCNIKNDFKSGENLGENSANNFTKNSDNNCEEALPPTGAHDQHPPDQHPSDHLEEYSDHSLPPDHFAKNLQAEKNFSAAFQGIYAPKILLTLLSRKKDFRSRHLVVFACLTSVLDEKGRMKISLRALSEKGKTSVPTIILTLFQLERMGMVLKKKIKAGGGHLTSHYILSPEVISTMRSGPGGGIDRGGMDRGYARVPRKIVKRLHMGGCTMTMRALTIALAFFRNAATNCCYPSAATLARLSGVSKSSIYRNLLALREVGVVRGFTQRAGGCSRKIYLSEEFLPQEEVVGIPVVERSQSCEELQRGVGEGSRVGEVGAPLQEVLQGKERREVVGGASVGEGVGEPGDEELSGVVGGVSVGEELSEVVGGASVGGESSSEKLQKASPLSKERSLQHGGHLQNEKKSSSSKLSYSKSQEKPQVELKAKLSSQEKSSSAGMVSPTGTPTGGPLSASVAKKNSSRVKLFPRPENLKEVENYVDQKKLWVHPSVFFSYYSNLGWTDSVGKKVRSWKHKCSYWHAVAQKNHATKEEWVVHSPKKSYGKKYFSGKKNFYLSDRLKRESGL